jgi:hypothetical protein
VVVSYPSESGWAWYSLEPAFAPIRKKGSLAKPPARAALTGTDGTLQGYAVICELNHLTRLLIYELFDSLSDPELMAAEWQHFPIER